jgi:small subunit ribosomal protein S20
MPITKSAKRALRGSEQKRAFNNNKKDQVNKAIKQLKKLVSEKKIKEAKEFMPKVQKIIDKSAKTGLIKANKASRRKSRLSAMVKKAQ